MKLFYYRRSETQPNFGDELNLWLWEKLLPGILDDRDNVAFVGIGTLLNNLIHERIPAAQKVVVFGTGVGYNRGLPNLDASWTIYCLRGPLSALQLRLPTELAITDPAILVRRVFQPSLPKTYRYSYMPHFTQSIMAGDDWQQICEDCGFGYIDARWPIDQVLNAISQTEVLLTEAMHGAIVADALRVPWVPIQTTSWLLPLKWVDWCMSMGLSYQPFPIAGLEGLEDHHKILNVRGLKGSRTAVRKSFEYWLEKRAAALALKRITKRAHPLLSSDSHLDILTHQLEAKLGQFKSDIQTGLFQ